tara:strand:- start:734 stop:952 length:219 start_codon:yes stop_codon:yes gene_type:complete
LQQLAHGHQRKRNVHHDDHAELQRDLADHVRGFGMLDAIDKFLDGQSNPKNSDMMRQVIALMALHARTLANG